MNQERRALYPKNWKQLADTCREQAGMRCEQCHVNQGEERISRRTQRAYTIYLHAAHKNHDPGNPKPELLCLCPSCHGRYDYQHLQATNTVRLEQLKHKLLLTRTRRLWN